MDRLKTRMIKTRMMMIRLEVLAEEAVSKCHKSRVSRRLSSVLPSKGVVFPLALEIFTIARFPNKITQTAHLHSPL